MAGSAAEIEIREAVVARLREIRPLARIVHELTATNAAPPTRIDVAAVSESEIIAVEIKSERDTLKRAADQIRSMRGCAQHAVAAVHEAHLIEQPTNVHAAEYERGGVPFVRVEPEEIRSASSVWVYPRIKRGRYSMSHRWDCELEQQMALPSDAIHLLWRDELAALCDRYSVSRARNSRMQEMIRALRWYCTGRELTLGICFALRARKFAEADPAITQLTGELA